MKKISGKAVSRTTAVIAVIVVIIIIAAGAYLAVSSTHSISSTTSSTSSTSTVSSSPVSSSFVTSSSSTSTSTSPSSSTTNSSFPSQIVVDDAAEVDSLDAGVSLAYGEIIILNCQLPLIFFGQYSNGTANYNQFIPVLASSWSESPNGTTYTFNMRSGVYFNNGNPFNAYVVWYNIYRDMIMNQAIAYELYTYFTPSGVTAQEVNELNSSTNTPSPSLLSVMENESNSVTVVNSTAVEFHLTNAFVSFLDTITGEPWEFVDPYVVEQNGGVVANTPNTWMAVNGTNIGDGPYVTTAYVPDGYVTMSANPNYWAQNLTGSATNYFIKPAHIKTVILNYKPDELTRELDLESNKAQLATLSFSDVPSVLSTDKNLIVPKVGISASDEFIFMDTYHAPLNNTLVREAIVDAINISEVKQIVFDGYLQPFAGPEPYGLPDYNTSITPPTYNVTLAKQLLAKAGYPNGAGIPSLNFVYISSGYIAQMVQLLESDLSQIGITIVPQGVTSNTQASLAALNGTAANAPDLIASAWLYWPDFSSYEYLVSNISGFYLFYNNQTITNQILVSNSQLNPKLRAVEISQIQGEIKQQAPVIWLGNDIDVFGEAQGYGIGVMNDCISGAWYNAQFYSFPYNSMYYTCNPSS